MDCQRTVLTAEEIKEWRDTLKCAEVWGISYSEACVIVEHNKLRHTWEWNQLVGYRRAIALTGERDPFNTTWKRMARTLFHKRA